MRLRAVTSPPERKTRRLEKMEQYQVISLVEEAVFRAELDKIWSDCNGEFAMKNTATIMDRTGTAQTILNEVFAKLRG